MGDIKAYKGKGVYLRLFVDLMDNGESGIFISFRVKDWFVIHGPLEFKAGNIWYDFILKIIEGEI